MLYFGATAGNVDVLASLEALEGAESNFSQDLLQVIY